MKSLLLQPACFILLVISFFILSCSGGGGGGNDDDDDRSTEDTGTAQGELVTQNPQPQIDSAELELIRQGQTLYNQTGSSGFSCVSCHGPDGKMEASFTPVQEAPSLRRGIPSATLEARVPSMWEINSGHGAGSYSELGSAQQQALMVYLLTLQKPDADDILQLLQ